MARPVELVIVGNNTSAIKAIDEVALASEATAAKSGAAFEKGTSKIGGLFRSLDQQLAGFGVPFTGALGSVGSKFDEAGAKGQGFGKTLSNIGAVESVAAVAGLAAVATEGVHLADAYEASHARLETAVKNAGLTFADEGSAISAANSKLEQLGFTNADSENSLSRLVVATRDMGKATRDEAIAADIARARHLDLTTATDLLVKVEAGRYTQLGRLGIATKDQIKGFRDSADAVQFLADKFKGQASAYADTFAGKIDVLKATATDLGKDLGLKVIPAIEGAASASLDVVQGFESANSATGGWLGKLAVAGAAIPIAVFAYDKLSQGLGALSTSYGRAATAVGLKSAADDTAATSTAGLAAAEAASVSPIEAAELAQARLVLAEQAQVAAATEAEAASVRYQVALAAFAAGEGEAAVAAGELTAAEHAQAIAIAKAAGAADAAVAAKEAAASADTAAAGAATANASSQGKLALAAGGVATTLNAAIGVVALSAYTYNQASKATDGNVVSLKGYASSVDAVARTVPGLAIGADVVGHAFGLIGDGSESAKAKLKDLDAALQDFIAHGAASTQSQKTFGDQLGKVGSVEIQAYTAALLAGKSSQDAWAAAGNAAAAAGSNLGDATTKQTKATVDAAKEADKYVAALTPSQQATQALADAQQRYADLLVAGQQPGETAVDYTNKLGTAKQAVVDASQKQTAAQNEVTAATQEGSAATQQLTIDLKSLYAAENSLIDSQLSEKEAIFNVSKAVDDYNQKAEAAIAKKGTDKAANDALTQSNFNLQHALITVAQDAEKVAEDQETQRQKTLGLNDATAIATAGHNAEVGALQLLAAQYPTLRGQIDQYIATLGGIPPQKTTTISVYIPPLTPRQIGSITETVNGVQVSTPVFAGPAAKGAAAQKNKMYLVGEEGPEFFIPDEPGSIVPHPLTVKLQTGQPLSPSDEATLDRLGVKAYASGGPVAPFGAIGSSATPSDVTLQFGSGTSGSAMSSVTAAQTALDQFINSAVSRLPDAQTAISDFAQTYTTDMGNVATATKNVNDAFAKYHQAIIVRNQAGRQVEADLKTLADLEKAHASAATLNAQAQKLAADQSKYAQTQQAADSARGAVLGAQKAEDVAKAALKRAVDPANFIREVEKQVSNEKLFVAAENQLIRWHDSNLARALYQAGPVDGLTLALGFAGNKADADKAEKELAARTAENSDYTALGKKLGATPKAGGGSFFAGQKLLVGEHGPELVQFPSAGYVQPQVGSFSNSGGVHLTLTIPAAPIDGRELVKALQETVKIHGPIRGLQLVP